VGGFRGRLPHVNLYWFSLATDPENGDISPENLGDFQRAIWTYIPDDVDSGIWSEDIAINYFLKY
jgi:hypothetical protein